MSKPWRISKPPLLAAIVAALCIAGAQPAQASPGAGQKLTGESSAQALAGLRRDALAIQNMSAAWAQIQQAAQSYGQLAPFAVREWAGEGPVVETPLGGEELCHNTRWDSLTSQLVTGGMNIAGDAEALAYAMEVIAVDFQQQYGNYLADQVADQSPQAQALTSNLDILKASSTNLANLLTNTGNQISAAIGTNSPLHPLPLQSWQAGIGDAPDLAAAKYLPGPNDGAPLGWIVPPRSVLARLVDICPTGTASVPMLSLRAPVLSAARLAITEAPDMSIQLQPLEGGSRWNLPQAYGFPGSAVPSPVWYQQRISLVASIAADMPAIGQLMQPISEPLAAYNQNVQQILSEVNSHA